MATCLSTATTWSGAKHTGQHWPLKGPSKYATKMAPTAPASCKGVKCFKPVCAPGVEVGIKPNACCLGCKGFLQTGAQKKGGALVQTKTAPNVEDDVQKERM